MIAPFVCGDCAAPLPGKARSSLGFLGPKKPPVMALSGEVLMSRRQSNFGQLADAVGAAIT
jgi:hypothetical protein